MSAKRTYFISGHRDITQSEFNYHYANAIKQAASDPDSRFVVGDSIGADIMAQQMLVDLLREQDPNFTRIQVFHMYNKPRNIADKKIPTHGGFLSHNQKDKAMTNSSDIDIAWVRPIEDTKLLYGDRYVQRVSGTEANIIRRKKFAGK